MLRTDMYLPLSCVATLNRHIKSMQPQFGFDKTLCTSLTKKNLKQFPLVERRGMLMFDEIKISKHLDFRADLNKTAGLFDFI